MNRKRDRQTDTDRERGRQTDRKTQTDRRTDSTATNATATTINPTLVAGTHTMCVLLWQVSLICTDILICHSCS